MAYGSVNVPSGIGGLPNLLDWSAFETVFDWSFSAQTIQSEDYREFLNVEGEGFLTFCRASRTFLNGQDADLRITVDGNVYMFEGSFNLAAFVEYVIAFKNSLKIEVYNNTSTAHDFYCNFSYKKLIEKPKDEQTFLISDRRVISASTTSTSFTNVVDVTGSGYLLGIKASAISSNAFLDIEIDNVKIIEDERVATDTRKYGEFKGPIRFDNGLLIRHRSQGSLNTDVFYTLD